MPYSDSLFEDIYYELEYWLVSVVKNLTFEGMWAFSYLKGANLLKSSYIRLKTQDIKDNEIKREIKNAVIDCDYGSIGHLFQELKDSSEFTSFLQNTFNDPRGVVCNIDSIIKQQHAVFLLIKDSNSEIFGMLDLFFSSKEQDLKNELAEIQLGINNLYKQDSKFKRLCINTFKIKQFEELLDIQKTEKPDETESKSESAIRKIEEIISQSSLTPIFYIDKGGLTDKFLGLNFEYIHSIISHEYRFCSLINNKEKCPHYSCDPNNQEECTNPFLNKYFFEVLKSLRYISYQLSIEIVNDKYNIRYFSHEDCNDSIKSSINTNTENLKNECEKFKDEYVGINDLARNKFKDEFLFSMLKKELKNKLYVLILTRVKNPHLVYTGKCEDKKTKKMISPSEILLILERENAQDSKFNIRQEEKNNVIHFEILERKIFVRELKKKIIGSIDEYCELVSSYIPKEQYDGVANLQINDLTFNYIGSNPIDENNIFSTQIKEQVNLIEDIFQQNEVKKHAVRAAISQVMARNMSHNIGSHVLSKMVGIDSAKHKFPLNNQYKSSFKNIYNSFKPTKAKYKDFNLANFNSYLRTRMDFLADIATGEPSMETTNLLVRDIIGEMDKNRILLNNISGVENFNYTIKVKDCRECEDKSCNKPACYCNSNNKDIAVSIPNGIMGYHALYVIIENIIRNTAKHQENSSPEDSRHGGLSKLKEFTIEIRNSKHDDTLYEAWLYDNIDKSGVKELTKDEKDFFKDKTGIVYNDSLNTKLDWLVFEQNARLNNSVINSETSRLREGAWGLIEMDASAAYLQKLAPEKIDQDIYNIDLLDNESRYDPQKNELNVLKAFNKNGRLGYRFHLLKPKELLIVDETSELYTYLNENGKSKFDILRENGIWVVQTENQDKDYFDIEKVYAHPFMLIITNEKFVEDNYLYVEGDKTKLFRGNLPNKIIVCKMTTKGFKESKSPWVAYIDYENELITALRNPISENLTRVQLNVETDGSKSFEDLLSKNTIMDLVWKVWLENKMEFHNIGIDKVCLREILPYIDSYNDKFSAVFALHGEEDVKARFNPPAPILDLYPGNQENRFKSDYFLAYPSSAKEFMDNASTKMINQKGSSIQNIYVNKIYSTILAESILNKILIIDERVQSSWESNYSSTNVQKNKLYKDCGMYCPNPKKDEKIDLNKPTFDAKYKADILKFIATFENNNKLKGLDYIVIHLGVIEKILTINNGPKKKTNVSEFILGIQNCLVNKTRVLITSGRGKPDNLPDEVPFISFSTLSQYTIETPFKPLLSQVIQRARIFKTR